MKYGSITTGIIADGLVFNMDAANRASTIPSTSTTTTFNTVDLTESGSLVTDATWTNSTITPSFDFDGSDGHIDLGVNKNLGQDLTVSFWLKRGETANASDTIFGDQLNGFRQFIAIDYYSTSTLYFKVSGNSRVEWNTLSTVNNTNWNNIVVMRDGTTSAKCFLNSIDQGTPTGASSTLPAEDCVFRYIGAGSHPYDREFYGNMGPIHIYNRALSANEVLHNYNALKGRFGLT